MTIAELKEKNITELTRIARTLDLPGASERDEILREPEVVAEQQRRAA